MDKIDDILDAVDNTVAEVNDKYGAPEEKEAKVFVSCPKCGKTGIIHVDKSVVLDERSGLFFYGVTSGTICEHDFIVLIDAHLNTR